MKRILFCILFFGVLFACKKTHTVKIKAINAVNGLPYAGLSYAIKGTKTGGDGEKLVFDYSGTLDANGEASPTIKVNENLTLTVGCYEPNNTCFVKDINFFWDPSVNPNPSFLFEYAECANFNLEIHNINCQGPNDVANFNLEIHNINCQGPNDAIKYKRTWFNGTVTSTFQTYTGCFDFTGNYITLPIGNYKYEWEVTRNGVTTYHDSLFSLSENQFYTFVLNY